MWGGNRQRAKGRAEGRKPCKAVTASHEVHRGREEGIRADDEQLKDKEERRQPPQRVVDPTGEDEEQLRVEKKWDETIVPVRAPPIRSSSRQEEFGHCFEADKVGGPIPG